MVKRLRESADNIFYCAEITYDKSGRNVCVYTADIKEVKRSIKPKDEMKVEGGFMVRRKYFRSREQAQSFIDLQDRCMTINKDESIGSKRRSRRMNESNGTINDLEFYIAQIQDTAEAIARLSDQATYIVNNYQEIEDDAGELRRTENDLLGFVKELQMCKEGFANYIGQMEEWVDNVLL